MLWETKHLMWLTLLGDQEACLQYLWRLPAYGHQKIDRNVAGVSPVGSNFDEKSGQRSRKWASLSHVWGVSGGRAVEEMSSVVPKVWRCINRQGDVVRDQTKLGSSWKLCLKCDCEICVGNEVKPIIIKSTLIIPIQSRTSLLLLYL